MTSSSCEQDRRLTRAAQVSKPTSGAASRPADWRGPAKRQVWKSALQRNPRDAPDSTYSLVCLPGRGAFPRAPAALGFFSSALC